MKKVNYIAGILLAGLLLMQVSCSDWLDVKPKANISEEDLFSRELGFKEALTGIYISMSSTDLYGRNLTYGLIDGLAQRYYSDDFNPTANDAKDWYVFPSSKTRGYINTIWNKTYKTIADINNLLAWIEKNKAVITTPGYSDLIKGEAIGLRAFLYFDLLRMYGPWGPVYRENPATPSIPYRTQLSREDKKLAPANALLDSLVMNLKQAEILLKDDPMHIEFPAKELDQQQGLDAFLMYRFKRMNKYAVKALLARVYLWKGNKTEAIRYAKEVISGKDENHKNYFELVPDNANDRIYSTELIFALSDDKFDERVEKDFDVSAFSMGLVRDKNWVDQIFDIGGTTGSANDMRYRDEQGFTFANEWAVSVKYVQNRQVSFATKNTLPLIRLSEMYYIIAECTDDMSEAADYLSMVRDARGLDVLAPFSSKEQCREELEKEFRKEFYAEGQLWYFYKRLGYRTFLHCPISKELNDSNYRFSIPEDEQVLGKLD